jgi:prevent-host-death family protein
MAAVSVTELNQQTAKVLERVKAGESLEVKEHGRLIAKIVPISASMSLIDRLVHEGRAIAATNPSAVFARVEELPSLSSNPSLSQALQQARDTERY